MSKIREDVVTQQFEFEEDSIDKIVEYAKNQFVGEIISDLGLGMADGISMESKDFEDLISDVFSTRSLIRLYRISIIRKEKNMINFAENEKRGALSIKEKIEEAKMIAGNHNLKVVMFLYKELGEVRLSTAYFSDMDSAEAYYDDRCKYMLGQYWSYMGYINGMWDSKRGVYVGDLEKEIA